jgi:ABC-type branched-subunit amino acid transport system permease subunit
VGATVGGIAGAVVVAFRTDLVPDEFEIAMAVALVILAAAGIVPLILNRAR